MNLNIPGIDIEKAIQNSGSEELVTELLGDVYKLMDEKCALVETYLQEQDLQNFTIQVHALKTTCRTIGAMDLGEDFFTLEKLGKENNLEQAEALTPGILRAFQNLKPYLAPFASADDAHMDFDKDAIAALLNNLVVAIDDFDLGKAETAMKALRSYQYDASLTAQIDDLDKLVTNLDYEESKALAKQLLEAL